MQAVALPPFELLYEEHRDGVYRFLVRRLGRAAAEDAFQETFLRALRAYDRLAHATNLRAWLFTIAERVSIDELRRTRPYSAPSAWTEADEDERPAYAELEHLTRDLPPTERAAVVLRYGYDLAYDDIGAALGSSAEAARAAASSGVRRIRRKEKRS
jgi:RNA polymerase sigma factor (sigma-70 family)